MWHDIANASWANIWAAISAISTASAVIVAAWAMLRWRKQDELKAKMAFKTAISQYLASAILLPGIIKEGALTIQQDELLTKMINDFIACRQAWLMLEGLLDNDKDIKNAWNTIAENHIRVINGEVKCGVLLSPCSEILVKKFVFK